MKFVEELMCSTEVDRDSWMAVHFDPFVTVWENIERRTYGRRFVGMDSIWYVDLERQAVVLKRVYPLGYETRFFTASGALIEAYKKRPMWDSEGPPLKPMIDPRDNIL